MEAEKAARRPPVTRGTLGSPLRRSVERAIPRFYDIPTVGVLDLTPFGFEFWARMRIPLVRTNGM